MSAKSSHALKPVKKGMVLGIELGGAKILAGVIDSEDKLLSRAKRATPITSSQQAVTDEIISAAEEALKTAAVNKNQLECIGMGSPGPLNPEAGIVLRSGIVALKNYPIGPILSKYFNLPVTLDNDVHMSVFGEFKVGAGKGCNNIVGLWIGAVVGGCVIRDGQVIHGANRNAGELGHVVLDIAKHLKDRKRGTLETEASKTGMTAFIRRQIAKGAKTSLKKCVKGEKDGLKSADLGEAYEKGDEVAVAAVEHSALYCGIAVANLFNTLSPQLFILGGGVVETLGAKYLKLVQQAADDYVYSTELAPIRLAEAQLGDDAGVLGAALAAKAKFM